MIWDLLNSLGRLVVVFVIFYKVTQFRDMMIPAERAGLSIMASGCLLTIPVIWEHSRSPFDGWSVFLLTYGLLIFLAGRTWRDRKHQKANDAMAAMRGRWKEQRQ